MQHNQLENDQPSSSVADLKNRFDVFPPAKDFQGLKSFICSKNRKLKYIHFYNHSGSYLGFRSISKTNIRRYPNETYDPSKLRLNCPKTKKNKELNISAISHYYLSDKNNSLIYTEAQA